MEPDAINKQPIISFLKNGLTLERPRFQTTENDQVRQLTHYVNKLYFVDLFDQVDILKGEISFVAP